MSKALVALALLGSSQLYCNAALALSEPTAGPWIAFRYDSTHVLFYIGEARDPENFAQREAEQRRIADPVALWGRGGYLLPLTPAHWATLEPPLGRTFVDAHRASRITVLLARDTSLGATVDGFVEQWGSSNPVVRIGILAHVSPDQVSTFHRVQSDYFLAGFGADFTAALKDSRSKFRGRRTVLNTFGAQGELVLVQGEEGWSITLWRHADGELAPTNVCYSYGD